MINSQNVKKISCFLTAMLFCAVLLTGCGGDAGSGKEAKSSDGGAITLKAGHDGAETLPVAKGLAKFKELLEAKTSGKIKVEIYNNGTLGSANDYVVNCQLGTLDIGAVNQSVLCSFVSDLNAVDIPYLIQDYAHADKLYNGELGAYYAKELEKDCGLKTIGIWEVGFRNLTNNKRPVNAPEDISGLRIRTMDSKVHQAFWKSMGADPVPMSWGEAYTAMQQGAIDGQENALSVILGNNVAEVNQNLALTEHVYSSIFMIMSQKAWDSMNGEQQKIVMECAAEAGAFEREEQRRQATEAIEKLKAAGMNVTSPDKQKFIDASADFRKAYTEQYPAIMKMVGAAQ